MKIHEIICEVELPPVSDPGYNRLLQRGHFVSHAEELPDHWASGRRGYRVYMSPHGGTRYVARPNYGIEGRRERYGYYDPNLADLQVHDQGEEYLERTQAHPKPGMLTEIPPLGPGFIYRGGSQEEFDFFQQTGKIESTGNYNLGDQQIGLTYWSTDPRQAESYSNSFAPVGYKATFQHPAYVWVAHAPDPSETRRVPGTGREEVGVTRAITADEIVQIWRGQVFDYDEGDMDIRPHDYSENPKYVIGSSKMPSGRVVWELIFNRS